MEHAESHKHCKIKHAHAIHFTHMSHTIMKLLAH